MAEIIKIECPICGTMLYIDVKKGIVVKHERARKRKDISLDELLEQQRKREDILEVKFKGAAELEKRKQKELEEKIKKALEKKEDDSI